MDTIQIPGPLPATVTRPRPLVEAVMDQSLREQGPHSRTAQAWQWIITGQGPSPVSQRSTLRACCRSGSRSRAPFQGGQPHSGGEVSWRA